MKTKITSFIVAALACALTFTSSAFAEAPAGFYEKEHVRGFISVGADYRGMVSEFQDYINNKAFMRGYLEKEPATLEEGQEVAVFKPKYSSFENWYLGMHVNLGAQYKQFMTWFDFNFMPTQVSKRPSKTMNADVYGLDSLGEVTSIGSADVQLYDVCWYTYGVDWMFGWKLFGERTFINLIPAVGFGMNLLNVHFPISDMTVVDESSGESHRMRDRDYSTLATTINAELEFRIELGRLALGAYGGYRFIRYSEFNIEASQSSDRGFTYFYNAYDTDSVGDTWFLGLRLTWYFLSDWQKKQADKL
ncbi:MAG: hypothetical protein HUK21_03850 [Fibrobacteraceae bacterium]|nr:hypothetical protein [Fibrobacteraceae bacterium]